MINEECNGNLSYEQKKALELSLKRESLFITGGAGTGKSYIIKRIIKELEKIQKKLLCFFLYFWFFNNNLKHVYSK